jgi:hypothetical protein
MSARLLPRSEQARSDASDWEHAMAETVKSAVAVVGIDVGSSMTESETLVRTSPPPKSTSKINNNSQLTGCWARTPTT